ncbi:alpha/beta hydrolase fold-3 domain containing protein [Colletotrichum tofieldiae]|uniref:Alpha/beta hydrolase fold-3 domain containing protein n=1 Tax=Colletotrichum tofieldiae TaxID=708197 RepID=A0A161VJP0_9PEZI|nr:alpha/beta hydrolase fold-3 domain containing protein [Colletotrichum tofieldiae]GKT56163.1 alpha/beta hydrolase fold-3 domain containing protein [Colletotrichum tofieldiae]GKT81523.1 alpha/beta hydrolase fold-3 domain containing protein [Colletotrichum tofieldiae]GKT82159.1 alpha/beta hydrolase fold-3 domain containing protein [Colletotrichum tofieldiae]
MSDFSHYGGPSEEWLAVEVDLPPPQTHLSAAGRKSYTNKVREDLSVEAMKPIADQLQIRDWALPTRDGATIDARTYRAVAAGEGPLPVYLYFHGGGFLFGTLNSEDASCARIALSNNVVVLNVNYRHTPEFVYPTAWNDAEDAFIWLHANIKDIGGEANKVVVGGPSAGGQLTASLTLAQHLGKVGENLPPIAGQVLLIPCLTHVDCYEPQSKKLKDPSKSSHVENKNAPLLPRTMIDLFLSLLKIENPDVNDLRLNPGNATPDQVKGLPPTTFGICGLDPFRDEGLLYAKMLAEAGVPTDVHVFKGVPHGFRRFGDKLSESQHWDKTIDDGIIWTLTKPAATGVFAVREL